MNPYRITKVNPVIETNLGTYPHILGKGSGPTIFRRIVSLPPFGDVLPKKRDPAIKHISK